MTWRRAFAAWLCLPGLALVQALALPAGAAPAALPAPAIVRYGVLAGFPPFQVWPEGSRPGGADVEIVGELARDIGVLLLPVRYTDFTRLEADLLAGRIQLASSMARTPARESGLVFTPPYLQVPLALVTRAEQPSGALMPDLAGRSVAVVNGYASQEQADRLFPLASRVVVGNLREGLQAVRSGRADTFLESLPVLTDLIAREQLTGLVVARRIDAPSGRLHLALPRSQQALAAQLAQALARYPAARIASLVEAWSARIPEPGPDHLALDAADRARLAAWAPPVIGLVGQDPPFVMHGPGLDGEGTGLAVDVLKAVLERLGLRAGGWRLLTPAEVPQALAEGRVDILLGADEAAERLPLLRFVGPFIEYPTVHIGRPEGGAFDLEQLHGRRLALTPNSPARPWVDSRYPGITVVDCPELEACIDTVVAGRADATLADVVAAALALARLPPPEVQMIGTEPQLRRYHSLGVAERHVAYVPLLKRALDVVVQEDLPRLKVRWFSRPPQAEVLRTVFWRWLPWGAAGLALMALLWWLHVQRLRAEVRRTRVAQQAAEQAGTANRRFTTFLAHEVRNSLHAVIAGTELAQDASRDVPAMNARLAESARSTLRLMNNLIDRERLDAGRLLLHPEPARLGALVRDLLHEMAPAAAVHGLALHGPDPGPDPLLLVDPLRLQQVLRNLLANAIKYGRAASPGPGPDAIEVELQTEAAAGDEADAVAVTLAVQDRGPGVEPSRLARLFEPFRGHDSGAGGEASAGLGLALSRRLSQLMGGELSLLPRPGGGTTARVQFVALRARPAAQAGTVTLHPLRVLVVEDSEVYGLLLARAFEQQGHAAQVAGSVAQAQGALREGGWDLLLTDVHLPDGTAHELLRWMRASLPPPLPQVVAMSADLESGAAADDRPAGALALLEKSGDVRLLVERVLRETAGAALSAPA
jgi:signal transduction histidine kinase/ActR/RegA family two-component response regulator